MRRRIIFIAITVLLISAAIMFFYPLVGIVLFAIEAFATLALVLTLLLNNAVKKTNWYKNVFIYTKQMCSNAGYRDYMIRNLDIVNVGSSPARFAFHYDNVLGENWSTGNQGKDMDFEILKFRHSFLKRGGIVLLPIVPFSSVAGYLKKYRPEYLGTKYYAKFASTLDPTQAIKIPECRAALRWINYPLFYNLKAVKYLLFDEQPDARLSLTEMPMMYPQLVEDARHIMDGWLKEFKLKTIHDNFSPELKEGFEISVKTMQSIIDFLIERELKPVIVLTPMSKPLQNYFTEDIKKRLIYDYIESINRPQVKFLDYSTTEELQDPSLYFNALFLNLRGRKIFTNEVLKDLKLIQ